MIIKNLRAVDYSEAISFAATGMNLETFIPHPFLRLYAWQFFMYELCRSTDALGAYVEDRLVGVLLADLKGMPKTKRHRVCAFVATALGGLISTFSPLERAYERANEELISTLKDEGDFDGELSFLAADPEARIKGVGTSLLSELECRYPGKMVYLYTDDACTYQFYERR